ncbi:MAG: MFS transporter, partial [Acidobacteriota bacterium]
MADSARITTKSALRLVVLLGVVSLFADMTYEGGRSITGPFLGVLGAGAAVVGVVAGFGELVGYLLRLASGYLTDRVGRYWAITFIGYAVNLLAVPLMALAGHWEAAAALIIAERLGKAARSPARDVILSHATSAVGRGWGFGLHEALDQVGAVLGPLIISTVLYLGGSYNQGFAALLVPALVALAVLATAWRCYPRPEELEPAAPGRTPERLGRPFWLYLAGVAFVAA